MGIAGKIYNRIANFLSDTTFKVKIGASFSETYPLENGTPQGSGEITSIVSHYD